MSGHTRLIRVTTELLDFFGTRTEDGRSMAVVWGEPIGHDAETDEYIYEPTFTATDDGWRERIEHEAVAAYLASPEAAEGIHALHEQVGRGCDHSMARHFADERPGYENECTLDARFLAAWQQERER